MRRQEYGPAQEPRQDSSLEQEDIVYLGLDRLGLVQPEQAIYRMVRKGILKPRRIGRFLAFSKAELDHVVANGKKKRTPGRPRRIEK